MYLGANSGVEMVVCWLKFLHACQCMTSHLHKQDLTELAKHKNVGISMNLFYPIYPIKPSIRAINRLITPTKKLPQIQGCHIFCLQGGTPCQNTQWDLPPLSGDLSGVLKCSCVYQVAYLYHYGANFYTCQTKVLTSGQCCTLNVKLQWHGLWQWWAQKCNISTVGYWQQLRGTWITVGGKALWARLWTLFTRLVVQINRLKCRATTIKFVRPPLTTWLYILHN